MVFACFRVSLPDCLGSAWLASSPFVLGFPWTLGSSTSGPLDELEFHFSSSSSLALRRHLSVLTSQAPPLYMRLMPTMNRIREAPHSECSALQHIQIACSYLSLSFESVRPALLCGPEVPPLGFGYPFDGVQVTRPSGASFSSQRSWASPFKAFLRPNDREMLSHPSLRSRAFLQDLLSLVSAPQRFPPVEPAAPSIAPQVFNLGQGQLAFLGFLVSRAFPPPDQGASFSLAPTLPALSCAPRLHDPQPEPRGSYFRRPGFFPPKRAPARLTFPTDCHPLPLEKVDPLRTIFSSQGPPAFTRLELPLLAADRLPPNGR